MIEKISFLLFFVLFLFFASALTFLAEGRVSKLLTFLVSFANMYFAYKMELDFAALKSAVLHFKHFFLRG